MKTFVKVFGILLAISFAMLSCSEDIFVHDGDDGQDGKDGYSSVTKVDPVYSTDGVLLGYTTSYYLDMDYSLNYTEGDKFDNSLTLFNGTNGEDGEDGQDGKDGKNGLDASLSLEALPPTDDSPGGSIIAKSYKGDQLVGTLIIQIPLGESGFSLVPEYVEVVYNAGEIEVYGTETRLYWDMNRDGKVSEGDEYKGGFITWHGTNGKDGEDGQDGLNGKDGQTPSITFDIFDDLFIILSQVDGVIVDSIAFEIPKNGLNGETPSLHAINFLSHWDCDGGSGIMYIWYFDNNGDGIDQPDEVISNFILCGCDCESSNFIPAPSIQDDFNHPDNSHHYWDKGYLFEEGLISINEINSPEGNGTVVLHKYGENWAEFYTPEFPESAITAVELDVGSRSTWKVELIFMRSNGSAIIITGKVLEGKSDVVWYETGTYGKPFMYYSSLDEIKFNDVIRVGFVIHKYGEWTVLDRNHSFNGDNLRIARVVKLK